MNKMLDDSLTVNISELAKAITDIQNRAIVEYTPLVNDICSRKTTKDKVDQIQSNYLIIIRWKHLLLYNYYKRPYKNFARNPNKTR